jgi:hypothetical protein
VPTAMTMRGAGAVACSATAANSELTQIRIEAS